MMLFYTTFLFSQIEGSVHVKTFYYDVDNFRLEPESMVVLAEFVNEIKTRPIEILEITGYVEKSGLEVYNQIKSKRRMTSIKGSIDTSMDIHQYNPKNLSYPPAFLYSYEDGYNWRRVDIKYQYLENEYVISIIQNKTEKDEKEKTNFLSQNNTNQQSEITVNSNGISTVEQKNDTISMYSENNASKKSILTSSIKIRKNRVENSKDNNLKVDVEKEIELNHSQDSKIKSTDSTTSINPPQVSLNSKSKDNKNSSKTTSTTRRNFKNQEKASSSIKTRKSKSINSDSKREVKNEVSVDSIKTNVPKTVVERYFEKRKLRKEIIRKNNGNSTDYPKDEEPIRLKNDLKSKNGKNEVAEIVPEEIEKIELENEKEQLSTIGKTQEQIDKIVIKEKTTKKKSEKEKNFGQRLSEIDVSSLDKSVVLVVMQIQFEGGKPIMSPLAQKEMGDLFVFLDKNKQVNAFIRGHVCCGDEMKLSRKRAKRIYTDLVKKGIDPSRLRYQGFSNSLLLINPERTEADRAKNRRVDIIFSLNPNYVKPENQVAKPEKKGSKFNQKLKLLTSR